MRLFGSDRIAAMMDKMGVQEGESIESGMMSKAVERAQKKVEENHFGTRKRLLEYDDVMNSQREVIYTRRRHALYGERIDIDLNNLRYDYAIKFVEAHEGCPFEEFKFDLLREVTLDTTLLEEQYNTMKPQQLIEAIVKDLTDLYERKAKAIAEILRPNMERYYAQFESNMSARLAFPFTDGRLRYSIPVEMQKCKDTDCMEVYRVFAKIALFTTIDDAWREHLREMDDLRQSVQNATYEQKDPLLIYKLESFQLFSKMLEDINRNVLALLNKVYLDIRENSQSMEQAREQKSKIDVNKLQASRMAAAAAAGQGERGKTAPIKVDKSVGRNDLCPCGSGKKYKHCHGKLG
jgi:preprotein translocase subunit SecA